jgi:hypothetical protein
MAQNPLNAFIAQMIGGTSYVAGQTDKQRGLWVSERHGKYYNGTYSGNAGFIASQAGVTLSALAATTYTGLAVQNPTGSGINIVIQKLHGISTVISAAMQSVGFVGGSGVFTPGDSLTPYNCKLGASPAALKGVVTASATVAATQVVAIPCGNTQIAAGAYSWHIDIDGELIIPPGEWGGYVQLVGTPTAATFFGSISWEEVAL